MNKVTVVIALLVFCACASILPIEPATDDFENYIELRESNIENYFGCKIWNNEFCGNSNREDIFKINKDKECEIDKKSESGCLYWYKYKGMCFQCKNGWKAEVILSEDGEDSSVLCVPGNEFFDIKGDICLDCREGYMLEDGYCAREKEREKDYDLGCLVMKGKKCQMCRPGFREIKGMCVKRL